MILALLLALPALGSDPGPTTEEVRAAVAKALPPIALGAAGYTEHRDCFSCHNQAMPVVALTLAKSRGFEVEDGLIQSQLEHTEADLASSLDDYRKGRGQPGGVTRAGYASWALEAGGWSADPTTDAVAEFFLIRDEDLGYWRTSSHRPPSEASSFTSTYLALRGLRAFGSDEPRRERLAGRVEKAREWLTKTPAQDNEDRVFRLWGLKVADAPAEAIRSAAEALRDAQREDGGWSQLDDGESDAYATGSALVALYLACDLKTDDPRYRRGLAFLLKTQADDGTWHVKSRSKPFQTYFESGFPYKADQFISIAASSWAAAALTLACPKP